MLHIKPDILLVIEEIKCKNWEYGRNVVSGHPWNLEYLEYQIESRPLPMPVHDHWHHELREPHDATRELTWVYSSTRRSTDEFGKSSTTWKNIHLGCVNKVLNEHGLLVR